MTGYGDKFMSELIIFTLNAIVIYLVSDGLLRWLERRRGQVLKYRQVVFFILFLTLAMASFSLLRALFQGG